MNNIKVLQDKSNEFFERHWDKKATPEFPTWSPVWKFEGEVHDNTFSGCYAWVKDEEIVYIGIALNKGVAGYEGHSLGTRISNYWRVNKEETARTGKRVYMPSDRVSGKLDGITILAFKNGKEQDYLAAALELYLIRELTPIHNKLGK